jgi:predicted transcriptional regulator of viral defense system
MSYADQILKIAYENNGTVTSAQITKEGINRQHLKILFDKGLLERSERGVYIVPSNFDDKMFNLQSGIVRLLLSQNVKVICIRNTNFAICK